MRAGKPQPAAGRCPHPSHGLPLLRGTAAPAGLCGHRNRRSPPRGPGCSRRERHACCWPQELQELPRAERLSQSEEEEDPDQPPHGITSSLLHIYTHGGWQRPPNEAQSLGATQKFSFCIALQPGESWALPPPAWELALGAPWHFSSLPPPWASPPKAGRGPQEVFSP